MPDQNKKSEVTADLVAAFIECGGKVTKCRPGKWTKDLAIAKNYRRTYKPNKRKKAYRIQIR